MPESVRISNGGSDGLALIPWLFTDPSEQYSVICSNFDGGSDGLVLIPWLPTDTSEPYHIPSSVLILMAAVMV
jgi:hypothetical protein